MFAEHGNPDDGHILPKVLKFGEIDDLSGCPNAVLLTVATVAMAYRIRVLLSGKEAGAGPQIEKEIKRRSAIEPVIGRMKIDGKLGRNRLDGVIRDKINALLRGAGH